MAAATETLSVTIRQHQGYKPWVARITGTDEQYGFARQFANGRKELSRSGRTGHITYRLEPGLYEIGGSKDDNGLYLVCPGKSDGLVMPATTQTRALAIAELLREGEAFEAARTATR